MQGMGGRKFSTPSCPPLLIMLRLSCELSPEFTGGWINGPVQITGEQSIQDLVSFFELQ